MENFLLEERAELWDAEAVIATCPGLSLMKLAGAATHRAVCFLRGSSHAARTRIGTAADRGGFFGSASVPQKSSDTNSCPSIALRRC